MCIPPNSSWLSICLTAFCTACYRYVKWLEANGLSDSVPRMEAHYLNPSPWAEKERYEIEFNDIQREVKMPFHSLMIHVSFHLNM